MADWETKADKAKEMKERKTTAAAAKACSGGADQLPGAVVPKAKAERERLPAE